MGQYYMPILDNVYGGQCKVFDRSVNGEYTMAKLLEHSWWNNTFVNAFSAFLYNNPGRVCWVGDYATEPDDFNLNVPAAITRPNYKKVWGKNVNFDTRQFLDLDEYKANSVGSDGNKKAATKIAANESVIIV